MAKTKDIKIFKPRSQKSLTQLERRIVFEQLEQDSGIEKYHFENFNVLEEQFIKEQPTFTELPSVLLIKLKNNVILITKKASSKKYSISTQFNVRMSTKNEDMSKGVIIPKDKQINVIGIVFGTNMLLENIFDYSYKGISKKHMILSGLTDLMIGNKYTQSLTELSLDNKKLIVLFKHKEHALKSLRLLQKYMYFVKYFYTQNLLYMNSILSNTKPYDIIKPTKNNESKLDKEKYSTFVKTLNSIYSNTLISHDNKKILLMDIYNGGLWDIYQLIKIRGLDSESVQNIIDEKKRLSEKRSHQLNKQAKLNTALLLNVKKNNVSLELFKKPYLSLSEKEKSVVDLTHEKRLAFEEQSKSNNCIHIKILTKTMKSSKPGRPFNTYAWEGLKKLIPKNEEDKLLQCNICKFLVLCPHHYDLFEYRQNNRTNITTDSQFRRNLMFKYADKTPIDNVIYCKICGEMLIKKYNEQHAKFIQGKFVEIAYEQDEIQSMVWKNVKNVIQYSVNFNIITDVNLLTSNITSTILPFIKEKIMRLEQNKTRDYEQTQDMTHLYVFLYTYAMLVRIMSHYPKDLFFKKGNYKKLGGQETINIKTLQYLLKHALEIILRNKQSLINKLPKINNASVKALFITAFKNVSRLNISAGIVGKNIPEHIITNVVYKYLLYALRKHDTIIQEQDIKKVLGVSFDELNNLEYMLDKAKIPNNWKSNTYNPVIDKDQVENYNNYVNGSFQHFIMFVKNKIYTHPLNSLEREAHENEYMKLLVYENFIFNKARNYIRKPMYAYGKINYGVYVYKKIPLNEIFCKNGIKHLFNIFIYKAQNTTIEISDKNIHEYMFDKKQNNTLQTMELVDVKCSKCFVLKSKTNTINQRDISDSLDVINSMKSFYNLYIFKCPVQNIHIFKKNKCIQCGATKQILTGKDAIYYEKYKKNFQEYIAREQKVEITQTRQKQKPIEKLTWTKNDEYISRLAAIMKVSENLVLSIGLVEGNNYNSFLAGELNSNRYESQLLQVESYVNNIFIDYEKLRNDKASKTLELFQDNWEDIDFSKFPDIVTDYHDLKTKYAGNTLQLKINFNLTKLSQSLITIHTAFKDNEQYEHAAHALVKYLFDSIILTEKSVSDSGMLRGKLKLPEIELEQGDAMENDDVFDEIDESFDPFSLELTGINEQELNDNSGTFDD